MKNIVVFLIVLLGLYACGSGGSTADVSLTTQVESATPPASYTSTSCTNMVSGTICTILLSFNNFNNPGLTLVPITTPPLPAAFATNASFNASINNCNQLINNNANYADTCTITILYQNPNPRGPNSESSLLTFSLGNVTTSPPILISGD